MTWDKDTTKPRNEDLAYWRDYQDYGDPYPRTDLSGSIMALVVLIVLAIGLVLY